MAVAESTLGNFKVDPIEVVILVSARVDSHVHASLETKAFRLLEDRSTLRAMTTSQISLWDSNSAGWPEHVSSLCQKSR